MPEPFCVGGRRPAKEDDRGMSQSKKDSTEGSEDDSTAKMLEEVMGQFRTTIESLGSIFGGLLKNAIKFEHHVGSRKADDGDDWH